MEGKEGGKGNKEHIPRKAPLVSLSGKMTSGQPPFWVIDLDLPTRHPGPLLRTTANNPLGSLWLAWSTLVHWSKAITIANIFFFSTSHVWASKCFGCIISLNLPNNSRGWVRYYPLVTDKETEAQALLNSLEITGGQGRARVQVIPLTCNTQSKTGQALLLRRRLSSLRGILAYPSCALVKAGVTHPFYRKEWDSKELNDSECVNNPMMGKVVMDMVSFCFKFEFPT